MEGDRKSYIVNNECANASESQGRDPSITSRIMSAIKGKDSKAEILFRKRLFARGVRYRKNCVKLPGTPDVVIIWAKVAVFIDGDFWHGNSWKLRGLPDLASQFPNRTDFWVAKISRNIERDKAVTKTLRGMGWKVVRFWESTVLGAPDKCVDKVVKMLEKQKT